MNKIVKALDKKIVLRASLVDIILGGFIFVLNLFLATVGVSQFIEDGYGNKYGVTPKTFPRVIFIAACVLALLMLIRGIMEFRKKREGEKTVQFHLISLAILALNVALPILARRRYLQDEARRLRREKSK